jgi:hypothetical protein
MTYRRRVIRASAPLHGAECLLRLRSLHLDAEHLCLLVVLSVLKTQLIELEFVFLGFGFPCHDSSDDQQLLQQQREIIAASAGYLCLYVSRL